VATQVPAFMGYKSAQAASLAGVIVCLATLVVYCIFQARPPAGWASEPRTVRTCPASCWGGLTRIPCFLPGLRAHLRRSEGAVHTRCQCIALVWWGLSTSAAAPACAGTGPPAASGGAGAACQADAAASPSGTSCSSARADLSAWTLKFKHRTLQAAGFESAAAARQVAYPELQRRQMEHAKQKRWRLQAAQAMDRRAAPFGSLVDQSGASAPVTASACLAGLRACMGLCQPLLSSVLQESLRPRL